MANSASPGRDEGDVRWMRFAVAQARRAEGRTAENPPVGCVITSSAGKLVGVGHTQPGGRPHAEIVALAMAGDSAAGGTAYVTLEPCAHHGKTGPCAEALVEAGITRVVAARLDPDDRVNSRGMKHLADRGIATTLGVQSRQAGRVMAGFLKRKAGSRPVVLLKTAVSLDGMIAQEDGAKRWITGPVMRRLVHQHRSRSDAILTAIGTVLADNPRLTCRHPGLQADSPPRFVLDRSLRTPPDAALFDDIEEARLVIFASREADGERAKALLDAGAEIVELELDADGRLSLEGALEVMASRGCGTVMVEAGGRLASSLLRAGLVDRMLWTQNRGIIGSGGIAAVEGLGNGELDEFKGFEVVDEGELGSDRFIMLECPDLID